MSRPANHFDVLDSPDSSGNFGRDEGIAVYSAVVSSGNPDRTIEDSAVRAARIAMIATGRFDVDPSKVAQAIVDEVTSSFLELDEAAAKEEK